MLIGREVMPIPVPTRRSSTWGSCLMKKKWAALAACDWLMMPSPHESLSMALLEAWSVGRPALVNAECDVLVAHCRAGAGGLWYSNYEEWWSALSIADSRTMAALGANGRAYVESEYTWSRVENDYMNCIRKSTAEIALTPPPNGAH